MRHSRNFHYYYSTAHGKRTDCVYSADLNYNAVWPQINHTSPDPLLSASHWSFQMRACWGSTFTSGLRIQQWKASSSGTTGHHWLSEPPFGGIPRRRVTKATRTAQLSHPCLRSLTANVLGIGLLFASMTSSWPHVTNDASRTAVWQSDAFEILRHGRCVLDCSLPIWRLCDFTSLTMRHGSSMRHGS